MSIETYVLIKGIVCVGTVYVILQMRKPYPNIAFWLMAAFAYSLGHWDAVEFAAKRKNAPITVDLRDGSTWRIERPDNVTWVFKKKEQVP